MTRPISFLDLNAAWYRASVACAWALFVLCAGRAEARSPEGSTSLPLQAPAPSRWPRPIGVDLDASRLALAEDWPEPIESLPRDEALERLEECVARVEEQEGLTRAEYYVLLEYGMKLAGHTGSVTGAAVCLELMAGAFAIDIHRPGLALWTEVRRNLAPEDHQAFEDHLAKFCLDLRAAGVAEEHRLRALILLMEDVPARPGPKRAKLPDPGERNRALREVDDSIPGGEGDEDERRAALGKYFETADDLAISPVIRYALLDRALRVATSLCDQGAVVRGAVALGSEFEVNAPQLLRGAATTMIRQSECDRDVVEAVVELAFKQSMSDVDTRSARESIRLLSTLDPQGEDTSLKAKLVEWRVSVDTLTERSDARERTVKACWDLLARPDDNTARGQLGRLLCLRLNLWPLGLPKLVAASEPALAAAAKFELDTNVDQAPPGKRFAVAERWWALAQSGGLASLDRTNVRAHAAQIYRTVAAELTGLERARAETRGAEAAPETPLAGRPAPPRREPRQPTPAAARSVRHAPAWCEVLDWRASRSIIVNASLRQRLADTKLPWRVRDRVSGIEMVLVPPGTYERGASDEDRFADAAEKPRHRVELTTGLYVGVYEVLRTEYAAVVHGLRAEGTDRLPLSNANWNDIAAFLQKSDGLRLPTEAEWEYFARAGCAQPLCGPLDDIAIYNANSGGSLPPAGSKRANAFGLHDVLGSLWEWCADWHDGGAYARMAGGVVDPLAQDNPAGKLRGHVIRGGGYLNDPSVDLRLSRRPWARENYRAPDLGFRVVRDP